MSLPELPSGQLASGRAAIFIASTSTVAEQSRISHIHSQQPLEITGCEARLVCLFGQLSVGDLRTQAAVNK